MILDSQKNRDVIDLIRAVAIFLVVAVHVVYVPSALMTPADRAAYFADFPVWATFLWQTHPFPMIFVVSGFLLCTALFQEHQRTNAISIRGHFVRRLSRVLPLYYIAVLFYGAIEGFDLLHMFQTVTFISAKTDGRTLIPVGWSTETMMHAYIVLPFLAIWVARSSRPLSLMLGMIAVALAARLAYMAQSDEVWSQSYLKLMHHAEVSAVAQNQYRDVWFRIAPFIMGMGLAYVLAYRADQLRAFFASPVKRWSLLIAGLVLSLGSYGVPIHHAEGWPQRLWGETEWLIYMWLQSDIFSAGLVFVFACALCWPGFGAVSERLAVPSRRLSFDIFGIYLFHWPFILIALVVYYWTLDVAKLGSFNVWHAIPVGIMALIPTVYFAKLVGKYLERPALRWLRKKLG